MADMVDVGENEQGFEPREQLQPIVAEVES